MIEYRRADDNPNSSLKHEILEALSEVDDSGYRVVLTLMAKLVDEISGKLDRVLADEDKLRHIVLNGHMGSHDEHHRWVAEQITNSALNGGSKRKIVETVLASVLWAGLSGLALIIAFYFGHTLH